MRGLPIIALLWVVVLVVPVGTHGVSPSSGTPSPRSEPVRAAEAIRLGPTLPFSLPILSNSTVPPAPGRAADAPAAAGPDSVAWETPSPAVPATTPTVITFLTGSRNCCVLQNFTAPVGPWETIVLNFTGQVVGGVYDSSYRAYIDRVEVLFGTSPEYGTWTVLTNLSEYASLFSGTTNLTFLFGEAVTTGYFLVSLSLAFYPVPGGAPAPPGPSEVLPLWFRQPLTSSTQTIFANATVPANTSAAELELYAYAFGPTADEFWWAMPHPLRVVQFGVTGTPLGLMLPFPYLNTGANDPLLWRPITGVFTAQDRPYRLNLTGALGAIEGTHAYWANVTGITSTSTWLLGGTLLLWTNASYEGATLGSTTYSWVRPVDVGPTESAGLAFGASSSVTTSAGPVNVSSAALESFTGTVSSSSTWSNASDAATVSEVTETSAPSGNLTEVRSYSFPLSTQVQTFFTQSRSTGGTYPIYGNVTSEMLNVNQEWNELRSVSRSSPAGPLVVDRSVVDDQVAGADGLWRYPFEFTSSTTGMQTGPPNTVTSASTKQFTLGLGPPSAASTYSHLLVGLALQPTSPDLEMALLTDRVSATPFPLMDQVSLSPSQLDVGQSTTLTAQVSGGYGPYSLAWSGLPSGCAPANSTSLPCTPSTSGGFSVSAAVRDAQGEPGPPAVAYLYVAPAISGMVSPSDAGVDVGANGSFVAIWTGGLAPYRCQWFVDGSAQGAPGSCSTAYVFAPSAVPTGGRETVRARVLDSAGAAVWLANATVTIAATLSVTGAVVGSPSRTVGAPIPLESTVAGGSGPISFQWALNGTSLAGATGENLTYVASGVGTYTFTVSAVDASGIHATSNSVVLTVSAPPVTPAGGGGASSTFPDWLFFLAVAAAVSELGAIMVLLFGRPRRPPPAPRRPASAPARPAATSEWEET